MAAINVFSLPFLQLQTAETQLKETKDTKERESKAAASRLTKAEAERDSQAAVVDKLQAKLKETELALQDAPRRVLPTKSKVHARAVEIFLQADRNHNGRLSHNELKKLLHADAELRSQLQARGGVAWKVRVSSR